MPLGPDLPTWNLPSRFFGRALPAPAMLEPTRKARATVVLEDRS